MLDGIEAARRTGLGPIKINTVIQRGINDHTVLDLLEHFRGSGIDRALHRIHGRRQSQRLAPRTRGAVAGAARAHPARAGRCGRSIAAYAGEVARRYAFEDGAGEIGFISSVTQPFCGDCSRARLSSDGKFYTCLFAAEGADLRAPLRGAPAMRSCCALIRAVWERRTDRYSELREQLRARGVQHVEMNYVGG